MIHIKITDQNPLPINLMKIMMEQCDDFTARIEVEIPGVDGWVVITKTTPEIDGYLSSPILVVFFEDNLQYDGDYYPITSMNRFDYTNAEFYSTSDINLAFSALCYKLEYPNSMASESNNNIKSILVPKTTVN